MLAKFVPMPLPAAWFRHTLVKSMNPIGVMYALPILNESGALSSTGAAGAGAGATTGVVVTGSVVAGGGVVTGGAGTGWVSEPVAGGGVGCSPAGGGGAVGSGVGCARAGDAMASASSETRRERYAMPPTFASARGASVTLARRSARRP